MNPMLIGGLAGLGLGFLKNKEDERRYEREQALNSVKARYSPWTGIHPTNPKEPSMMGNLMSGGMTGMMFGQGMSGMFPGGDGASSMAPAVPGQGPTVANDALVQGGGPTPAAEAIVEAAPSGQNVFAREFPHGYETFQPDPVAAQAAQHRSMMAPAPQPGSPWDYMYPNVYPERANTYHPPLGPGY